METSPGIFSPFTFPGDEISQYFGLEPQNYGTLEERAFGHQYDKLSEPVLRPVAPKSLVTHPRKRQTHENGTVSFRLPLPTVYFS
jgi:hypothetical protein